MAGSLVKGWLSRGVLKPSQVGLGLGILGVGLGVERGLPLSILAKVLASVPAQDSALLEPLTSLGCAGETIDSTFITNSPIVIIDTYMCDQIEIQEQTTTLRLQIGRRWGTSSSPSWPSPPSSPSPSSPSSSPSSPLSSIHNFLYSHHDGNLPWWDCAGMISIRYWRCINDTLYHTGISWYCAIIIRIIQVVLLGVKPAVVSRVGEQLAGAGQGGQH